MGKNGGEVKHEMVEEEEEDDDDSEEDDIKITIDHSKIGEAQTNYQVV